jgi:site-specific DNA-methyltransferase (adenine-specific)
MIEVINLNCLDYLQGPFAKNFDFILADPFFNIGQKYAGFVDKVSINDYHAFTSTWIRLCWNHLLPGCAMVMHGSVEASRVFIKSLYELDLEQFVENEICWAFNFGQHTYDNFVKTHCRAIIVRKPGSVRKWNEDANLIPSKRLQMGDRRVLTSKHKGMVPLGTVWGIECTDEGLVIEPTVGIANWGRVQGNNFERRPMHPNQLPEAYCSRFIRAYSNEGDLIFDPFGGSGTTAICAQILKRNCITTEISKANCDSIKQSLIQRCPKK